MEAPAAASTPIRPGQSKTHPKSHQGTRMAKITVLAYRGEKRSGAGADQWAAGGSGGAMASSSGEA